MDKEDMPLLFSNEEDGDNVWMIYLDHDAEQITVKTYPLTAMPSQIQKCHDVWANTLEGQLRMLALELEKLIAVVKREFLFRYAARALMAVHRLTKARRKP